MPERYVADEDDLADGERLLADVEERSIGVFRIDGEFYAYADFCVHQGGPCCEGTLTGTKRATFDKETLTTTLEWEREGEILNCPWHGWEYDIETGECLFDSRYRLPSYPVRTEDGKIFVDV